jgi:hypothetical protein
MKHGLALAVATVVAALAAQAAAAAPGPQCGGTLWKELTLADNGKGVNWNPLTTTVGDIAKLTAPARITAARTTSFQKRVWKMDDVVIDRYRIASNGEIALILYSIDTGQFMNAYLPAAQCLGPRARNRTGMLAARRSLVSNCPRVTAAWQLVGITVEIGGVGFWNPSTATRGALANGAELRPVTNLKVVTGCGTT